MSMSDIPSPNTARNAPCAPPLHPPPKYSAAAFATFALEERDGNAEKTVGYLDHMLRTDAALRIVIAWQLVSEAMLRRATWASTLARYGEE